MKIRYIGQEAIVIFEHGSILADEVLDVTEAFAARVLHRPDFEEVKRSKKGTDVPDSIPLDLIPEVSPEVSTESAPEEPTN